MAVPRIRCGMHHATTIAQGVLGTNRKRTETVLTGANNSIKIPPTCRPLSNQIALRRESSQTFATHNGVVRGVPPTA